MNQNKLLIYGVQLIRFRCAAFFPHGTLIPISLPHRLYNLSTSEIFKQREGSGYTFTVFFTLERLCSIRAYFFTAVQNIYQYALATILTFPCSFLIIYNWLCPVPPLHHLLDIFCHPFLINTIINNDFAVMVLVHS